MTIQIKNTKDIENHNLNVLVYGESGSGKTTLSGTVKNAVIISAERGLLSVKNKGIDYIDLNEFPIGKRIDALRSSLIFVRDSSFDWVILDSITEIAQILVAELKLKYPSKSDSLKMWGEYSEAIVSIIKAFRDLNKNVVFTALSKTDKDESGMRFIGVDIQGSISNKIEALFDEVFFLAKVVKDDEIKRVLLVETDERYKTKDRSGMLNSIEPADLGIIYEKIFSKEVQ